ncbi:MAG: thioredoxin family protein [Bacteroidia bacterium]|nr:thioredoxin family protein [Bacteroidia bacterium]MCF8426355.1 thioredoxin family protein [Bacteroidia bacterium]MCF8445746.1 thioredoxin family protein [Bacteroidia bacterium]
MLGIRNSLFLIILLGLQPYFVWAQLQQKPVWELKTSKSEVAVGDELELIFISKIQKDWYMYANDFSEDVGPTVAFFDFKKDPSYQLIGKVKPVGNHKHFDEVFGGEVSTFEGKAEFRQKVKILRQNPQIKVSIEFQECSTVTGMCVLFEDDLIFKNIKVTAGDNKELVQKETPATILPVTNDTIKKETLKTDTAKVAIIKPENLSASGVSGGNQTSLVGFLLFAFFGGLIAVVTPCVFPMLPMTVTFFTKRSETRALALKRAFGFGLSIIGIYASLGLVFAFFGLGADFGNWLSTHWLPNILFFIIFIFFAASFLGMFEITLPHQFVNSVDSKSSMGSFMGVFFMAFTLVLVSFSCTGPIVGSLLIEAVGGNFVKPLLGMAAFGAGLAAPFTLFAIFPSWIQNLPKSGGWLNSVKVVLGFLELAFAFKFLSIPDQTYHWGLLDREVYISIWIVVFFLLGLYLLGKLKFSHDSDLPYVSVPRLVMAIITFTFVLYLLPGLFGAPLKALSGYLPPKETLDFDLSKSKGGLNQNDSEKKNDLGEIRFKSLFHLPHELNGFFDYKQALAYSKKVNKPIFIDFTGHGCVNCREMEANVWSDPEVLKRLSNDYVVLALYVDDKTELPENEWYTSSYDNREKKTIGKQNADLQISKYKANAQPYYVLIDGNERVLAEPKAYDLKVENFVNFLEAGKKQFSGN